MRSSFAWLVFSYNHFYAGKIRPFIAFIFILRPLAQMYGTSLLLFFSLIVLSSPPARAETLTQWIHTPPCKNCTLVEEIQCYSLPYGGIGFASHILTYYTIAMLAMSRKPYAPWLKNTHSRLDILLSIVGLIVTIIVSSLTIVRCRSRWQFIAIAAWKLDLSVMLGFLSLHAAVILPKFLPQGRYSGLEEYMDDYGESAKILFWLFLYIPGVVAGLAGLFSLVGQTIMTNKDVKIITAVFGGVTLALAAVTGLVVCCALISDSKSSASHLFESMFASGISAVGISVGLFAILGAFYSDWILAAIAENLSGAPSSDNAALYWSYFAAKRLPFFSS
jgi:hypothetical protein